ncbi:MAG TPA: hypothetical protein VFY34_10170 [Pyrinomonadaceae bacterium]|nr:hypothetical protein [Pyrinomonadaceae bacterium]
MPSFTTSASESVPIPAQTTVNVDGSRLPWIPSQRLPAALRSDPRTDVGEIIQELIVSRRDQTGRAELVSITGRQKRSLNGWEFKLIVGRALGWNVLKSSRFTISPSGSAFVFQGCGLPDRARPDSRRG